MSVPCKGFVVAAAATGSGKTTVSLGLMAAFRRRHLRVQPFKIGPDYIDPAWHERVCGRASINLDPWLTSERFTRETFAHHTGDADIAIVEGVMGLFDSAGQGGEFGSTAHVAKLLGLPVLLVLDTYHCAESAAAILLGCERFDPELRIAGVVLNRVGGPTHREGIARAMAGVSGAPILGALPIDGGLELPERQLGLVSVHERGLSGAMLERLAHVMEEHVDLDALWDPCPAVETARTPRGGESPAGRASIGVARDEAFCFYYADNLRLLREAGAEIVPFSPLRDRSLPPGVRGLYFGGGFPEEFGRQLGENTPMLEAVRRFEGPILAECGGLMYLCDRLAGSDGREWPMAGRVPGVIEMTGQLQGFGYREVTVARDNPLMNAGSRLRGHEFHWSRWRPPPETGTAFDAPHEALGYGDDGTLASYLHVHFGGCPEGVNGFVDQCGEP